MLNTLGNLPLFKTYRGRHILSVKVSKFFEKRKVKNLLGANLVAAIFFTGVISPQANNAYNRILVAQQTQLTPIFGEPITETTFTLPLTNISVSQYFSFYHPGLDLTAPSGSPIYSIEEGIVDYSGASLFGYGKHVIVKQNNNISALYAHMSEITTQVGKNVQRGEMIGKVGSTGWSTGNHLHIEITHNNQVINPLEVLPIESSHYNLANINTPQTSTSSALLAAKPNN